MARSYGFAATTGAATSTDPAQVGAGYLARQLAVAGGHFETPYGPDYGLTLDAVLALDAAGVGQDAARTATTFVADHVRSYVTGADFGAPTDRYAGALAKSLTAAVAQGVDPRAFGGLDLVAELSAREDASGRFSDASAYGDYSNTFTQSFAVLGLHRAGAGPDVAAVTFLRAQQCPAGGFRLQESATPCTDDSTADVDSTALAVQALISVSGSGTADVSRALSWLVGQQQANGGFGGSAPTTTVNANSTGLAAQALVAGGRSAAARQAVDYLTSLQYGCAFPSALRGGIAYSGTSYADQQAKGSAAVPDDQDRRSTAQAVPALASTPLTVVTGSGAVANAPALACASASTTSTTSTTTSTTSSTRPSTTSSSTTSSSTSGAASAVGSTTGAPGGVPVAGTQASALPYTGADVLTPLLVALALIGAGAVALLVGRRRTAGRHA